MQKLKVLVLYGLILAAVIYGAIKAYVYFGIKSDLDSAIAQARPFAQISYGGISSSLQGSIEVDAIEVKSAQQTYPIRIGSLRLQGDGPGFLFRAAQGFGQERIPTTMQVSVRRLELPDIQKMVPAILTPNASGLAPVRDQCSLGGLLHSAGLLRNDSYPLLLDLNMGYQVDHMASSGRFEFGYDVQGGDSLSVTLKLSGMPRPGAMMMGEQPSVDRISFRYQPNAEYLKTRVSDCAKKKGMSRSIYIERLLAQPADRLANELGFAPGNGLRRALVSFLVKPLELVVVAGPIDQPSLLSEGRVPPERLVDFLNLEVSINGQPVTDLSFTAAAATEAADTGSADGADSEDQGKKVRRRARYIETPIGELGRYLGRPVQLSISGHSKVQSGVLAAVRGNEIDVEKRMRQGKFSLHVALEDIKWVKVLRFPDRAE